MDKLIYLNHITKNILHPDVQTSALWNNKLLFQYIQSTKIQKIRNLKGFAARVALGNINKYGHRIPYVNKLKWLKIQQKCRYDTCILIHKFIEGDHSRCLMHLEDRQQNTFIQERLILGNKAKRNINPRTRDLEQPTTRDWKHVRPNYVQK